MKQLTLHNVKTVTALKIRDSKMPTHLASHLLVKNITYTLSLSSLTHTKINTHTRARAHAHTHTHTHTHIHTHTLSVVKSTNHRHSNEMIASKTRFWVVSAT
jgi:hypothetical protein